MNNKKVAILQSNYIPWKGNFDMIAAVDEFILFDDMQYTRRDWRNRNKIKTPQGLQWLTIPVVSKSKFEQKIRETKTQGTGWQTEHWRMIELNYKRASYFDEVSKLIKPLYDDTSSIYLSEVNKRFLVAICDYIGIKTKISNSWDYSLVDGKTERLADLCKQAGGTEYISGPAARDYIDEQVFRNYEIKLTWFDYNGYKEYPQLWGEFEHGVSILDLLFNCGKGSVEYMRYAK